MDQFISILLFFLILLFSVIIHEYMHGWTANYLGDPTAKNLGRLTLNPLAHIDPIGTILLPLILYLISSGAFLFGWAKPVPYNPYNLRDQRYGPGLVALAGPFSNLLVALIFGFLIRFLNLPNFIFIFSIIVYLNLLLAVFNLIPVPPLDGSKILYSLLPSSPWAYHFILFFERYGLIILLIFIFFGFHLIVPFIFFLFKLIVGKSFFLLLLGS